LFIEELEVLYQEDVIGMDEKGGDFSCGPGERVKRNLSVREVVKEDYGALLACGESMHAESVYSHMDLDNYKLIARFEDYRTSENKKLFVLDWDGLAVGVLFAHITPMYFGHDSVGYEETCFVFPEVRELGGFDLLLGAFEKWCSEMGAKALIFDIVSRVKVERTEKKLQSSGFDYAGATMVKRI
jgi:hypothetical protein